MGLGVVEPVLARDSYLWLQSQGDLECPGDSPFQLMGIIEPCTSDSGYTYSGITIMRGGTGPLAFPDSFTLLADCYIIDPEGNRFVGAENSNTKAKGDVATGRWVTTKASGLPHAEGWIGVDNSVWLDAIASGVMGGKMVCQAGRCHYPQWQSMQEVYVVTVWWLRPHSARGEHGYWCNLHIRNCSSCARWAMAAQPLEKPVSTPQSWVGPFFP